MSYRSDRTVYVFNHGFSSPQGYCVALVVTLYFMFRISMSFVKRFFDTGPRFSCINKVIIRYRFVSNHNSGRYWTFRRQNSWLECTNPFLHLFNLHVSIFTLPKNKAWEFLVRLFQKHGVFWVLLSLITVLGIVLSIRKQFLETFIIKPCVFRKSTSFTDSLFSDSDTEKWSSDNPSYMEFHSDLPLRTDCS